MAQKHGKKMVAMKPSAPATMMKPQTGPIDLTEDNSDSEEDGDVIEEEDDEDVE